MGSESPSRDVVHAMRRRGYTLAELLIVVAIIGIITSISVPRLAHLKDRGELSGATTRLNRAVMAARQAAIQRGQRAYFKLDNSVVWVMIDTLGTGVDSVIVSRPFDIKEAHNVDVSPSSVVIEYDPRGIATQPAKTTFVFTHRSALKDSLCVSKLGNTIREKCPT